MVGLKEKCGIAGIYGRIEGVVEKLFNIMNALQHRGQEGAGVAFHHESGFQRVVTQGLVRDLFQKEEIKQLERSSAIIGHIRYSTTGSDDISNLQPFASKTIDGKTIALAHNGNITNALEIRNKLMKEGHTFLTTTDSEVMLHHIVKEYNKTLDIVYSVKSAMRLFEGSFSILLLFEDTIIAFRDKYGFRPLVFGRIDDSWFFASEDSALKTIDIFDFEEVLPGEIVVVGDGGLYREKVIENSNLSQCIFELVYFAKPSSNIFSESVYNFRYNCGRKLAMYDKDEEFDGVVPIPDSGLISGIGYSDEKNVPIVMGLIRSHFTGRSFIQPSQSKRDGMVKTKFFVPTEVVKNKKLVLIDDSIVRGTTMRTIVELLRKNGAREVHLRIASPPVKFPCYFGIDFPSPTELIANQKNITEIKDYLNVDSIKYLSYEDMMSVVRNKNNFCSACFTGAYKQSVPSSLGKYIFEVRG